MNFQVAKVKKPLLAVKRITEKGNRVQFGPGPKDNFIESLTKGAKIDLTPNGRGSYLMEVEFVGGGKTQITVDSGAEESVCPEDCCERVFECRIPFNLVRRVWISFVVCVRI
jgi:hypothetical protein